MDRKPVFEELAQREQDGILVRLWWLALDDSVTVTVRDNRTGDAFTLHPDKSKALDCYYHPLFYKQEDGND